MIESYALTDIGCARSENQDRVLASHSLNLFVVADGMGGHRHGEMAAELAISTVQYFVESSQDQLDATWPFGYKFELSGDANRLSTAIQLANRQVWKHAQQSVDCAGMGTTIAAVMLSEGVAIVGNVGDSRVYLFRANELKQITFDDTLVNTVAMQAGTDVESLANHPMRNVLTQAAGSEEAVEAHVVEQLLRDGDVYLICSDGLHGVVGNSAIRSILGSGDHLEQTALRLRDAARTQGGPDNISVVLVSYNL